MKQGENLLSLSLFSQRVNQCLFSPVEERGDLDQRSLCCSAEKEVNLGNSRQRRSCSQAAQRVEIPTLIKLPVMHLCVLLTTLGASPGQAGPVRAAVAAQMLD